MKRKWEIRIAVLLILLIFGVYVRIHRHATSYIKTYNLVKVADSTGISLLRITNSKDTILLKNNNGKWDVVYRGKDLPANNQRIWELVNKLLKSSYQVAGVNTKDFIMYGIDSTSFVFAVKTKDGKETIITVGKRGPTYSSFYFVFPDRKKIYLLSGIPRYSISTRVDDYRDRNVVDIKKEDLKLLTIINNKDTLVIKRMGDSLISTPKRDTASLMSTINRSRVLTAFAFADTVNDSITGLDSTSKKVIYVTESDDTIVLYIGNKGKSALYVKSSKRPGEVFKVYKSWFDEVLKKAKLLTDLKK